MTSMARRESSEVLHAEREILSADGTRLFVQRWAPPAEPVAELMVVHGYFEHGGRYRELAHTLAKDGIATTALDLRGHGRSQGRRGYCASFEQYLDDVEACLGGIGTRPLTLLGHSFGGLIALDFVSRRDVSSLSRLVITNPLLGVAVPVPPLKLWAGKLAGKLYPKLSLPAGMSTDGISRDGAVVEAYKTDPYVFTTANAGWFRESTLAQGRVNALSEVPLPLFFVYSDSDPVAAPAASRALAERLSAPEKRVEERRGELHEVLNELDRAELHRKVRDWVLAGR